MCWLMCVMFVMNHLIQCLLRTVGRNKHEHIISDVLAYVCKDCNESFDAMLAMNY